MFIIRRIVNATQEQTTTPTTFPHPSFQSVTLSIGHPQFGVSVSGDCSSLSRAHFYEAILIILPLATPFGQIWSWNYSLTSYKLWEASKQLTFDFNAKGGNGVNWQKLQSVTGSGRLGTFHWLELIRNTVSFGFFGDSQRDRRSLFDWPRRNDII